MCHDPAAAGTPAEQWAGVDCQEFADTVCAKLAKMGESAAVIGEIVKGTGEVRI